MYVILVLKPCHCIETPETGRNKKFKTNTDGNLHRMPANTFMSKSDEISRPPKFCNGHESDERLLNVT